jgi:hypothetical protein
LENKKRLALRGDLSMSEDIRDLRAYSQIMILGWEFQDPKMEVLYHTRPYFVGIFPYIGLKNTYIGLKNMRLVPPINRFLKWPLIKSQKIYIYIKISYSTSSYILLPMNSPQKMGFILR